MMKTKFCLESFKGDLEHLRAVKEDKHNKFAKEKDMHSFKVSAKTGESVWIEKK